ncbi:hypothetical protein C7974DRAFT_218146 [Boeremia exigua]|uniref:uncharacterized protein n=1 Tax=Boeremia exigua TaxID=749465 RepID=UPI001E8DB5AD|nr:uncharacterized protein C7974DRAFT_218146 [Boeremia exigua]KAH6622222.1 hypothetical protein C7974DRAFT_218146 [Boeremia exigua]
MSAFTPATAFQNVHPNTSTQVSGEERSSAIDFVNRLNYLFEEFDTAKMLSCFLPDAVTHHFHGTIHGHAELEIFFRDEYPPAVPGVSRHATNHIVDRDEETGGVIVRYHNQLVRYAWPDDANNIASSTSTVTEGKDGLPGLWVWSPMIDRLKQTEDGWKIYGRVIGGSIINKKLSLETK